MIPNNNEVAVITSNMTGETQFTVDENSLTHIMSVLTNLYADPEKAVVREYLTNAYDSHVQAGMVPGRNWRPIEVTTPSHFNKSYIIKDYGLGMSIDDLKNVYSKYGASTKRDSNTVVGMLGLGSKSALTYTNSFTITARKAGVQAKALVSVNEDGVPVFHIVDTRATDEPNGVEINIPVKDRNSFAAKTAEFLKFWPNGIVLVDGKEPAKHDYPEVKPDVHLIENTRVGWSDTMPSKVVMGNVTYDVAPEYVDQSLRSVGMGFVAYVNIGDVAIVPSREALNYNTTTKATLKAISSGLMEHIVNRKRDEYENASSLRDAWLTWNKMASAFRTHPNMKGAKYKGLTIVDSIRHPYVRISWGYDDRSSATVGTYMSLMNLMEDSPSPVIVTGCKVEGKTNGYFKKKVLHYAKENGYSTDNAFLVEDDVTEPWLVDIHRVDADTIKAIKLPRSPSATGPRTETPYDYYTIVNGGLDRQSNVKVPGKKIAYITPADMRETRYKRGCNAFDVLNRLGIPDLVLVVTGQNRFDKFLRSHPHAKPIFTYAKERVTEIANAATDAEFIAKELSYSERGFFEKVKPDLLDDPAMADLARTVQSNKTDHYSKAVDLCIWLRRASIDITEPSRKNVTVPKPSNKYPILEHVGGDCIADTVLYMNAKFAK